MDSAHIRRALRVLLMFLGITALTGAQQAGVVLTSMSVPYESASGYTLRKQIWTAQKSSPVQVFCVGSQGMDRFRFSCPDCNSTEINETLRKSTRDLSAGMKHPIVELTNFDVTKEMNDKTLACEGVANDGQQDVTYSTNLQMTVHYLDVPRIVNTNGEGPVLTPDGRNLFYIEEGGSLTLACQSDNLGPKPASYLWQSAGKVRGRSQTIQLSYDGKTTGIQCGVENGVYPHYVDSAGVELGKLTVPKIVGNNFNELTTQPPFENGKIQIGKGLSLECKASGSPAPKIIWLQQAGTSIRNISQCLTAQTNTDWDPTDTRQCPYSQDRRLCNLYQVSSQCRFTVQDYGTAGRVWCSACNAVSATGSRCVPSDTQVFSGAPNIDVFGRPLMTNESAEQVPGQPATVRVNYCADPPPKPRAVYWMIGGERVDANGEQNGNFRALRPENNRSFPDCFIARLQIDPLTQEAKDKIYQLKVENKYGGTPFPINVKKLLSGDVEDQNEGGADWRLAVGLSVGLLVLIILLVVIFMWWRGVACFSGRPKKKQPSDDKFHSNIAPEHVRSEPAPTSHYDSRPATNGYNSSLSEKSSDGFYNPNREGISYAEMDLVRESTRPPASRPTEYSGQQHPPPYQLKPPTNSVV